MIPVVDERSAFGRIAARLIVAAQASNKLVLILANVANANLTAGA